MVFSSLIFIFLFLPITWILYYSCPKRGRNFVLFFTSLIFYSWGEPKYIWIMLFTVSYGYLSGLMLVRSKTEKGRKFWLILSLIINLSILGFFKYTGFFVENMKNFFGLQLSLPILALPLGISFYTFQTLSYTIDVYRRKVNARHHFIPFATYVTMFPQLVAGPIVRYADIDVQLDQRKESLSLFGDGVEVFLMGLAKKVLLANTIGLIWDKIKMMPSSEMSVSLAWIGIIAFTFQIYFDFSAYSDMAVGLGKMFGFDLMRNFDYPYLSKSVTEFWRRWHISLGNWFREYVYIPLGGNKKGIAGQIINLFVVWFLTGLWHGASWNFVYWGLYYGVLLMFEKLFLKKFLDRHPMIGHGYTLIAVIIGWALFEHTDSGSLYAFFAVLFGKGVLWNLTGAYYLRSYGVLFILGILFSTPLPLTLAQKIREKLPVLYLFILGGLFLLTLVFLVNESYNPFLYFRF